MSKILVDPKLDGEFEDELFVEPRVVEGSLERLRKIKRVKPNA